MNDLFSQFKSLLNEDEFKKLVEKSTEGFEHLTSGHHYKINYESLSGYKFLSNQEIKLQNINFISVCKHHLLPFHGTCDIEYKSNEKILGLSKIKEIVKKTALKLTLQEELTSELFQIFIKALNPLNLKITLKGKHACMMLQDQSIEEEIITIQTL
jgi:GTP cyclohydrolase I